METFITKDVIDQLLNYPLLVLVLVIVWMNNKTIARFIELVEKLSIKNIEKQ